MTAPDKTVTRPWENTRKPVSRGGTYPTSVTLRQGAICETRTFNGDDAEGRAQACFEQALAAGFKEIT